MKTLYIDCAMGAAGDMLTAALLELMPDRNEAIEELNALGLPKVRYEAERSARKGIAGTLMRVYVDGQEEGAPRTDHHHGNEDHGHADHDHEDHDHSHSHDHDHADGHTHDHEDGHAHHHDDDHCDHHHPHHGINLRDIMAIVRDLDVPEDVRSNIVSVFSTLADAESHVHGKSLDQIHLHEVGTVDAIADIAAVCLLIHKLTPVRIVVSPIHVGSGTVKCAHGILPVPAPATAYLLKDCPIYSRQDIVGELCTPTGAALLTHFADEFAPMPAMTTRAIGYGLGKKDFSSPNCLRVFLGDDDTKDGSDLIVELSCNLDDMTAEDIGFAMDCLYEAGAVEVFTIPAGMKKNRPGILLTVLVSEENEERAIETLFLRTTTLGIRRCLKERYILQRNEKVIDTPYGPIRKKTAAGYGVCRSKYEHDDLRSAALKAGVSVDEIRRKLEEL